MFGRAFVCMLLVCIVLVGCSRNNDVLSPEISDNMGSPSDGRDEIQNSEEKKDNAWLYFDYNYKSNCLELTNLMNGKVLKNIPVGKKENIAAVFQYKDGYVVAKQILRKERDDKYMQGLYILDISDMTEKDLQSYEVIFYDKDLKQHRKIEILDVICESGCGNLVNKNPILNWTGTKIAWMSNKNQLLCVDLQTRDYMKSSIFSKKEIDVKQISFVGEEKVAFIGDEGAADACYGYFDLKDEKFISFIERNYNVSEMHTNGRYICVNDVHTPGSNSSSGRILVLDCETDKQKKIELDGLESTMAIVTENGKYVIAVNWLYDCEFLIRQYDFQTGERMDEKVFRKDENVRPLEILQNGDTCSVVYQSDSERGIACEIGID